MKKIFSLFVACTMALTTFATTQHIYINNQVGWESVALYAWADGRSDIIGGWPGIQPAAEAVVVDEVSYLDFAVEDTAFPANFIFNDNGGGNQLDNYYIETAGDYYLVADASGLHPAEQEQPTLATYHVYVNNQTGWDNFYLYAWGDAEVFGNWPGTLSTAVSTVTIEQIDYLDFTFQVEEGVEAVAYNLIFHNNVGEGQEGDHRQLFSISQPRDYHLTVPAEGKVVDEDVTFSTYHAYVNNQTGWDNFYLYSWGDGQAFGDWPGVVSTDVATVTIDDVNYLDFEFQVQDGIEAFAYNLIFHNYVGEGQPGDLRQLFTINEARDYHLTVPAEGNVIDEDVTLVTYHLYVNNQTDWENFYLYAWGDKEYFGNWPGVKSTDVATVTVDNVDYLDFQYTVASTVTEIDMNLIFHNNVGEGQEGDKRILMQRTEPADEYLTVSEDTQALENTATQTRATKTIKNGQLIIIRDGVEFNAIGTRL